MSATTLTEFEAALLGAMPSVRRYVRSRLVQSAADADDLMQETLARALAARDSFTLGTNMTGWLVMIARHAHFGERRARRNSRPHVTSDDVPFDLLPMMVTPPAAEASLMLREAVACIRSAPPAMRDAFIAVRLRGESQVAHAQAAGCELGTVKSRVGRMQMRLERATSGGS